MLRLVMMLAITFLLGIAPSSALARETPPDHDDPVDWVEVPDHGFGVALPGGWSAEWIEHASSAKSGLVLTASGPEQYCLTQSGALKGMPFDEVADLIPTINEAKENTFLVEGPIVVDLPAGPGVLFDVDQGPEPLSPAAQYLIDGGDRFLSINCVGHERPEDDWRSIASAFEWIPLRRSHINAGVAITWPLGWNVTEYEDPNAENGLIYGAMGDDAFCLLSDEALFLMGGQDGRSLDAVVAAWRDAEPLGEPVDVGGRPLGVERAVRLDGTDRSMFFLTADETIISLSCQAMPPSAKPPADRWLSIAETFEFLPAPE